MKKLFLFIISVTLITLSFFTSCKSNDPADTTNVVNQFVYDGMSLYYFWADEVTNKKPTSADTDPTAYFDRILNATDKDHGWSWITDDVQALIADFAGEPKAFGFSLTFAAANQAQTEYYAIVKYVFPNTPASNAGIKRKDIIGKINGNAITENNYTVLYGNDAATFTMYKITTDGVVQDRNVTLTPVTIQTNPVYCDSIYEIGGKKIGYLFYTDFIDNYNNSLYQAFSKFKQAGVTDLVLDLRYNHGGAITAATYLSSLIAPATVVENKSVFAILSYNSFINNYFDQHNWSRKDSLGTYQDGEENPLNANLNLNKVYIIATSDSYSASELTTFCLKPYMDVVHIGGNTGGKYTASWTIHAYDTSIGNAVYDENELTLSEKATLKDWAMQPIVAKYTNKDGNDFSSPGYLTPAYSLKEGGGYISNWTQIGDTKDTYLGQAIYLITEDETYKPAAQVPVNKIKAEKGYEVKLANPMDMKKSSVILNNVKINPQELQKIMRIKKQAE
ncbi:conserved exported hypothetical protein [uncultured Paludibacter sp.]|uniref:Tail specific protease domain-containing protein n=1 Tax=uncultured Paludibacter sp. TaxID=497635 RepID=A0A653AKY6_9BACT|nr:conserved exported hypothetical protein [uncultured Paludibacter sp.]